MFLIYSIILRVFISFIRFDSYISPRILFLIYLMGYYFVLRSFYILDSVI